MASRTLVSGLPRSLPPLPPGPAPTCVPCVEGPRRAAPHSSEFPPTEAPLQTLHMDVRSPARVRGQGHERYFPLVIDDYLCYTTVFPLRRKGEVTEVLIDWIRGARRQLSESFGSDLPILRLHSDRGGEFSSDLLRAFCRAEGIRQMFTLLASPQKNVIAERRIGMVMDVARTSMIHAAAPHFLWPFAVQYAAHQINLQPHVSLPETTPTLRWTGKVGDASVFRVWGSRAFVRDNSADKLSSRAVPCVFLGFPPDAPGWQFYHPTSRRVLSSQDITLDKSVSYYHPVEPVEIAVNSGAARGDEPVGAGPGGAEPGVAESEGAEPGGAEPERVEPGGAEPGGFESGGVELGGAEPECAESGGPPGVRSWQEPLSPHRLREWYARATGPAAGGAAGGAGAAGPGGARTEVLEVLGLVGTGAVSAVSKGAARPRPYYVPLLQQFLGREPESRPASPKSRPASPDSHPASPVRTGQRVLRQRPPPFRGTHSMTLRPSTAPQRVPLPSPPASSLPDGPDPESDSLRAASPTVTHLLATVVTDPLFESSAASALVAKLVDFAVACRLDYAASLVAESESASVCPPSVGGEGALGTVKRPPGSPPVFKARYLARGFSQRQGVDFFHTFSPTPKMTTLRLLLHVAAQRDYELHFLDFSTAFLQGSLHEEIWLRRPPGFTGSFPPGTQRSLRRPVYGLHQAPREWHDTLRMTLAALEFAPSTADPLLFLRTDTTLPPFYILVYVDDLVFATADIEALAHVKSVRITRDKAQRTITLTQSHMVQQVLQRFGFMYSSPQSTPLPAGHSLSAPPSDESVEPSGQHPELVGCLMYLMTCTRPDLAYPLSILARYVAPGRHKKEHMDAAKRVLRYLCSTSGMGLVLGGRA
ncbi:unnamed protein product [Closterium sp. NIES-53]